LDFWLLLRQVGRVPSQQSPLLAGRAPSEPTTDHAHADLLKHLSRSTGLPVGVTARVLDDVLAWFGETTEEFVRRRHRELQRRGLTNDAIFTRIAAELPHHRVVPGALSMRQLRRLVYG
jgi:hypothetical protein